MPRRDFVAVALITQPIEVLQLSKNLSAIYAWLLAILVSVSIAQVPSQQTPASPDRDRGIELYQQGDANGAVEALRHAVQSNEKDGTVWHYLGLAYLLKGSKDDARKSFARAVAIREAALQSALPISTSDPAEARSRNANRFQAAAESLEKYLELSKNPEPSLLDELDTLRWYRDYYNGTRNDEEIVASKEATTRVRILEKPAPNFSGTRAAGTGVLRAVLSADGIVKHILVVRKIDPDFDWACALAAKRIQFVPATKDGHTVSTIVQVEYGRTIY